MLIEQIPIFKYGQRIKQRQEAVVKGQEVREGSVLRQDSDSKFVLIKWDDGGKDWRLAATLEISTSKAKKVDPLPEIDEESLE